MKSQSEPIQRKATDKYFPVVLFTCITPYKVFLIAASVYEKCDHKNKALISRPGDKLSHLFLLPTQVQAASPSILHQLRMGL